MERKHRLLSLLSIVIIVIVLALIGKNMKVTAFIEDTFISGWLFKAYVTCNAVL